VKVTECSQKEVLSCEAYLLFYQVIENQHTASKTVQETTTERDKSSPIFKLSELQSPPPEAVNSIKKHRVEVETPPKTAEKKSSSKLQRMMSGQKVDSEDVAKDKEVSIEAPEKEMGWRDSSNEVNDSSPGTNLSKRPPVQYKSLSSPTFSDLNI